MNKKIFYIKIEFVLLLQLRSHHYLIIHHFVNLFQLMKSIKWLITLLEITIIISFCLTYEKNFIVLSIIMNYRWPSGGLSVKILKFSKVRYIEKRYIGNKFIIVIDYNNPFRTSTPLYQDFTYDPVYRRSGLSNFTV
jgi:hypothetical protein